MSVIQSRTLYLPEIISELDKIEDPKARVDYLKSNASPALTTLVAIAYGAKVKILLTKKDIDEALEMKFKPNKDNYGVPPTHLFKEHKRLKVFTNYADVTLPKERLQLMLVQMRECLSDSEFKLMVTALRRDQLSPVLTKSLAKKVFTGL